LHVLRKSLKLPPSESESFTISCIVSFPIDIFCKVFSELTLSLGFSLLLVVLKTSANCWDHIHTVARHGMRKAKKCAASDGRKSAAVITNACIESKVKTDGCATVCLRQCTIRTYTPRMNLIQSLKLLAWGCLMVQT
jgi:hypothetical protein